MSDKSWITPTYRERSIPYAIYLLALGTKRTYRVDDLAGRAQLPYRVEIARHLLGRAAVTRSESGINSMARLFMERLKVRDRSNLDRAIHSAAVQALQGTVVDHLLPRQP